MNPLANKIQLVLNTLEGLDIKATYDNMSHLLGVLQALMEVRDELNKKEAAVNAGTADIK